MRYDYQTDPSISLLDAVHDNRKTVDAVCDGLDHLASAFRRTGNHDVADELFDYIEPLMQSARQVAASYSIDLNGQVRQSQESSFNLLRGVLAGIEIGAKG